MDVEIIEMNHNGDGIGKIDGKVIFVPKSITGDKVVVHNVLDCGNYFKGEIDSFVQYSDRRVPSLCPYYDKCGGCQIMNLSYDYQLEYKKDKVIDIFRKYCDMDLQLEIVGSSPYSYRNKVIFQVRNGKIGFFEGSSNRFIEVDRCLLISDRMNEMIFLIQDNVCLDNVYKIMLRDSLEGVMLVFYGTVSDIDISVFDDKVCSVFVNDKKIYGKDTVMVGLGDYSFVISPNSFFQINLEQTLRLYSYIRDNINLNNPRMLDLYCGVGSIGIFCCDKCREVVGIEINEDAISNACVNKKINGVDNIHFQCLNANQIHYKKGDFDVVVVDPPRGGLDKKTLHIIDEICSKMLIYVSCNPVTLARDMNVMVKNYDIVEIKLFDMFPNTYHVETVCVLERINKWKCERVVK